MRLADWSRSLAAQSILGIILPIVLVTFGLIAAGLFAYQQMTASLVVDRDRQLATLIAANITQRIDGYAGVLEALASNADLQSPSATIRGRALADASEATYMFDAGVVLLDNAGAVKSVGPAGPGAPVMPDVPPILEPDYFRTLRDERRTLVSHVLTNPANGERLIIIGAPTLDQQKQFTGALLGAVYLREADLGATVQRLAIGARGLAYVVDSQARVLFHPDASQVGLDYSNRPFVHQAIDGESGGTLLTDSHGERIVQGYAPVPPAAWGLIVVEPWDAVVAPVQAYSTVLTLTGLVGIAVIAILLWYGVRRIANPVRQLADETNRLAAGEEIEPIAPGGILELDLLGRAFSRMAAQIASYRAGLQRYLGAITQSQEDERRRLARDLHDETTQSLLAITRQLELQQTDEKDPEKIAALEQVQAMLADTLAGIRRISRDLRPLILEDLGLGPALEMLARTSSSSNGEPLQVTLTITGEPLALTSQQELSLYRITQEALVNVRKHARALKATVNLTVELSAVRLTVTDDGQGFQRPRALPELAQQGHFGLMGIQERVWAVGGTLSIQSAPGQGTELIVTMPLDNGRNMPVT